MVCAFDTPKPTFRHELYKEYKAHRPPMPDELAEQMPRIYDILDAGKVEATLTDGVLLIKLPKAESAKPKKIKVSTAGK